MNQAVRWKPSVTVAAVIEQDGRFLLVEEHTDAGLRLNQPAGHLDPDESLVDAVAREALEETAYSFVPTAFLGCYMAQFQPPQGIRSPTCGWHLPASWAPKTRAARWTTASFALSG